MGTGHNIFSDSLRVFGNPRPYLVEERTGLHLMPTRHNFHIADNYFYEELVKLMGQQAGNDWLRSVEARMSCRALRGLSPSSTSLHSNRTTPQSSNPSTPRMATTLLASSTTNYVPDLNSRQIPLLKQADKKTDRLITTTEIQKKQIEESGFARNSLKLGLLYTDAAHSVLHDKEIADFFKRRDSITTSSSQ
jgi:hypothetical protein